MLNSKQSDSFRPLSISLVRFRGHVRHNELDAGCFQGPPGAWKTIALDRSCDKKIVEWEIVEREKLYRIVIQMIVMSRCQARCEGKQRRGGALIAVTLGKIELTDAAPCIRSEGQQRVNSEWLARR